MTESQQRYRVVEKLESGGMAEVFRAESEGLQGFKKQVAIKRVLPHLSEKKKFIAMFLDEARLSAKLSHSNCVQVFDIGVGDSAYFIVMEFVEGANLKAIAESVRKQGRMFPVQAVVFLAHEICKGLAYAHELTDPSGEPMSIVHRDMSPPNVLITKFGEVKIVDFGLAKASSQLEKSEPGIIKGKFSYLAPEAATGQEVDARADIFAVGIILWELLTGQRLFLGETDYQTVKKVQACVVPAISSLNRDVPPELERIVMRALQKETHARYQTARELGQDLLAIAFRLGAPYGTFDLADLVQGTMREKARRVRAPQGSIIDKLIEEALLEFTSLGEDDGLPSPAGGAKPPMAAGSSPLLPDQFLDVKNWANELKIDGGRPAASEALRASLPPEVFETGNLAALEEGPLSSPSLGAGALGTGGHGALGTGAHGALGPGGSQRPAYGTGAQPAYGAGTPGYGPQGPLPGQPLGQPMPGQALAPRGGAPLAGKGGAKAAPKNGSPLAVVAMLALALGAGIAAAWFGGLIPH